MPAAAAVHKIEYFISFLFSVLRLVLFWGLLSGHPSCHDAKCMPTEMRRTTALLELLPWFRFCVLFCDSFFLRAPFGASQFPRCQMHAHRDAVKHSSHKNPWLLERFARCSQVFRYIRVFSIAH
mmetsp:Transcript_2567/g.3697  ORF Transcript_2567/g.3697 Transcript_2567/m.3697 type:complete len:124 (-) Transcript_2567:2116-2487(-)